MKNSVHKVINDLFDSNMSRHNLSKVKIESFCNLNNVFRLYLSYLISTTIKSAFINGSLPYYENKKENNIMIQKRTIGLVGTGNVGIAAGYALFLNQTAGELIFVDKNQRLAEGEAMDMMHGQPYVSNITVRAGNYSDLSSAQVIIISAGVGQRPGENRMDLLGRNVEVLSQIIDELDRYAPNAILLIASNPVDILTHAVQKMSRRNHNQVIGTGTMLDSGRFRALLGRFYGVDPRSVHAYIIGEHGDTEVPLWSTAFIAGIPIMQNKVLEKEFDQENMNALFLQVRNAAYEIVDRKGYTSTAIGSVIARLTSAILNDQKSIFTVSVPLSGEYGLSNVCLSIPSLIGLKGVEAKILPKLNENEKEGLEKSAQFLRQVLKEIGLN
jgi:L-lactate dehydrogenase